MWAVAGVVVLDLLPSILGVGPLTTRLEHATGLVNSSDALDWKPLAQQPAIIWAQEKYCTKLFEKMGPESNILLEKMR